MFLRFFTNQFNFFDRFEEQVGHAVEAARFFQEVAAQNRVTEEMLNQMAHIEHQGDNAAHTIIAQLNKTFITPFDREDIHALAMELDDITDMIHNIVSRLRVYDIIGVDRNLVEFAAVIEQSVRAVATAIRGLRHSKNARVVGCQNSFGCNPCGCQVLAAKSRQKLDRRRWRWGRLSPACC